MLAQPVAAALDLHHDGVMQQAPAPRFSRSTPEISHGARIPGEDTLSVLKDYGFSPDEIDALRAGDVIAG